MSRRFQARSTTVLIALMAAQSVLGLLWPSLYRDVEWIRATWFGNDCVTLVVAVPLLWMAQRRAVNGRVRWVLVWCGVLGYDVYNYAFYLFGAALNACLPLYILTFVLSTITLGTVLAETDVNAVALSVRVDAPLRFIGGYLLFVASGLATVWLAMWGAYAFLNRPTPIDPEAFKIVAALDLSLMVPALAVGGLLLWRRRPWGYVIATIASIQGALYLLVLTVNSAVAIRRGLVDAPGELPLWAPLALFTGSAALILLQNAADLETHSTHERRS